MSIAARPLCFGLLAILASGALAVWFWLHSPQGADRAGSPLPGASAEGQRGLIELELVARGFHTVTDIQRVPGSDDHAVVLVKGGRARFVSLGTGDVVSADRSPLVFQVEVRQSSELGLLGMAFHPKYQQNGLFYVNYTPNDGEQRTRISEWHLEKQRLGRALASERRIILEVAQPYDNHNAGQLVFGPDGMLYIGVGDGGRAHDPHQHGQNLATLLGSMLRIDIDRSDRGLAYAIPKDNPFVGEPAARPEIWAYGLRNPWRYSFDDRKRLIVADVGQDRYEEVDIVGRGDNLGWAVREARHCLKLGLRCASSGFKEPIFEYGRELGQSIIGGYQYRGARLPALKGKYVLADYQSGRLWALSLPSAPAGTAESQELGQFRRLISTFGQDGRGELYVGDFGSGDLLKLVPASD